MLALDTLKHAQKSATLRLVIRANGTIEVLDKKLAISEVRATIKASTLDTVLLADRRHVMLVDDNGHFKELPVNEQATALYLDRCFPGTLHQIRGDVVVVPDSDFAS